MNETFWYYVVGIVYFSIGILSYLLKRKADKRTQIHYPNNALADIKKLEQAEPSNRPPTILFVILVVCSFPMLAFGVFAIWLWASGRVPFKFDPTMILFGLIFLVFPLYILIDTFLVEPKRFKLQRSFVAKEANVDFELDSNAAFERCLNALTTIHANVMKFEKPKYIVAHIDKSKFSVSLKQTRGPRCKASVVCDSQWVTVKFDSGSNRKYLNQFLRAL